MRKKRINRTAFLCTVFLLALIAPNLAWSHGGGLDGQGGHNDRTAGTYHFHQGPLDGQSFATKAEATAAVTALDLGEQPETALALPAFDLTAYMPAHATNAQIVVHQAYTLQYDEAHEQAAWVLYRITEEQLNRSVDRSDDFRSDPGVATGSATLGDYRGSGYDRGHMAPAAAMAWSPEAMSESFFLSNMSPQDPGFNRGIWRLLEQAVRDFARLHGELFVVTGPVLTEDLPTIGSNGISIPQLYYKVLIDIQGPDVGGIAFVLPNESSDGPLTSFAVSIDAVEDLTGLNFFPILADSLEETIEASSTFGHWGLGDGLTPTAIQRASWATIKATD
jgi:endonuclease G